MCGRIGVMAGLAAFAVCIVAGGVYGENTFATTLSRALMAMGGSFAIGLVVGAMVQRMMDEKLRMEGEKSQNSETESVSEDR